jgi:pyruvate dehydrogenase E2 component (dihydrolipoyllysine-residue acetyltransferase)
MAFEFRLPDIGEGVVEGEIVKWHVRPGQSVKEDDPLVEVMTDKATVMIPSPRKGKILETRGEEGGIVKVGAVLLTLETGDGSGSAAVEKTEKKETPKPEPQQKQSAPPTSQSEPSKGRALATPALRKMAQDMGIDINSITGSGPGGRITKEDIVNFQSSGASKAATPAAPPKFAVVGGAEKTEEVPFRGLRKKVAEKMTESKTHAVHYTYVDEIDVTELVKLRNSLKDEASAKKVKLTYLPFIIKALVEGLKKYPLLNSSLDENAGKILIRHYYHMGIGVATPDGLTVVVVKNADQKSIFDLANEVDRLSEAARQNKVALEDLKGSTFTITSLGTMGGMFATPVINYPEVAIVGIHKIEPRPVVHEGQIVIRDRMYMSLSFDHRVVDGAVGAEFTQYVKRFLENPAFLFIQL